MKKTLITLAALAMGAVAQAAEVDHIPDLNLAGSNLKDTSISGITTGYTMMLILDWDKAVDATNGLGNWTGAAHNLVGTHGNSNWWGSGISVFKSEVDEQIVPNQLSVSARLDGKDNPQAFTGVTDTDSTDGVTVNAATLSANTYDILLDDSYVVEGKVALTFTFTLDADPDTNGYQMRGTLYALKNDNSLSAASVAKDVEWDFTTYPHNVLDIASHESVEQLLLYKNEILTPAQIQEIALMVVPEPATATLSLLALAGLAARRRRK